jgi:hypothetical protein
MSLHHHHHSSLQKNLWCNNAQPLKFSLKRTSLQAPAWCGNLRQASFISTAVATAYHPIKGITLVGAIGVIDEAVGAGDLAIEDGTTVTSADFSSCTSSSSSSKSLRMMILSSVDDPRKSRLRSPKSFLTNSSSHETSAMRSPSSKDEERSVTRAFLEDPPHR